MSQQKVLDDNFVWFWKIIMKNDYSLSNFLVSLIYHIFIMFLIT